MISNECATKDRPSWAISNFVVGAKRAQTRVGISPLAPGLHLLTETAKTSPWRTIAYVTYHVVVNGQLACVWPLPLAALALRRFDCAVVSPSTT